MNCFHPWPYVRALTVIIGSSLGIGATRADAAGDVSIQAAIDANPGRMIEVPAGEHRIDRPLRIRTDGTGLHGYGTIIQTNPDAHIIEVRNASGVRIESLTLTRPQGKRDTLRDGIYVTGADEFRLRGLRIANNRSQSASIRVHDSSNGRIVDCHIVNYKRIGVDDRTGGPDYGYAFRVIIGDGILITGCTDMRIAGNTVIERNIFPSEATKKEHRLGRLTDGREPTRKGRFAPPGDYASNWHQGSAIIVTGPETTRHVLVQGNLIVNAAQGVDIHADHVTFTGNVIHHAFVGIKCMHGSRNVVITNNNVSHNDLWGLIMQPGTASHRGTPVGERHRGETAKAPNATRGNLIANNVFSDFGYGYDFHNWKETDSRNVMQFEAGPLDENPPLTEILVQGNLVYDAGQDRPAGGTCAPEPPRYNYAVFIDPRLDVTRFRFSGNRFNPGARGVSNVELPR